MMNFKQQSDVDLAGKRVLIREDLNVPIKKGLITSDRRLQAALPTLRQALEANAAVMVLSHLGRPQEGEHDPALSLKPVADYLAEHLDFPVHFVRDYLDGVDARAGELVVCENVRFNVGERDNDAILAKRYAALCDVFVMDAFGTSHRVNASTCGVAAHAPIAVSGPLLYRELNTIAKALVAPKKPIVAIVGGAKVSSKLTLLRHMVEVVDYLIPGGGIANTFLKAKGFEIGKSLCDLALVDEAKQILACAEKSGCQILLPTDVVVGKSFDINCPAYNKALGNVATDDMIMDAGPSSVGAFIDVIETANTVFWNGPLGVFEFPQFSYGTRTLAIAIAKSSAYSIAGGGDTLAAIDQFNLNEQISYVSTGGGAFLVCLEGKTLPAVDALRAREDT